MSDLEHKVKPTARALARGKVVHLAADEARSLCHWAVKTAMMGDLAREPESRAFPGEFYPLLKLDNPPRTSQMWLGKLEHPSGVVETTRRLDMDRQRFPREHGGLSCFVFGYAAIVTMTRFGSGALPVYIDGGLSNALSGAWPTASVVRWPPPVDLSREQASVLLRMFEASARPIDPLYRRPGP